MNVIDLFDSTKKRLTTGSFLSTVVGAMLIFAATMMTVAVNPVYAGCGIEKGSVRILSNDFPAIHAIVAGAESCAGDGVEITKNQTTEHRELQVAALQANPAEYTSAVVANGSLVPLLNEGLVRPLDDYVARYGSSLKKNQLITVDGKIMAIAFMANAQHLFYREDVLNEVGVEVPATYEDLISAAKAIKDAGIMEYPVAGTYKAGWNLAEEFINMYLGFGGEFFKPGSAEVSVNNENGVGALNMMKSLSEYMNPDFLTHDSNAVQAEWEAGKTALVNMWGSRAGAVLDDEGSTAEVTDNTRFAGAPTVGGGSAQATTLWWDGFTIAQNISDEDAEATFQALMQGISTETATANADAAVWLIDGYTPGPVAVGVAAVAESGAEPYPMLPYMGLLHSALGDEIVEFMQGSESAEKALQDVEAAYSAAAKEGGFL